MENGLYLILGEVSNNINTITYGEEIATAGFKSVSSFAFSVFIFEC